MIKAHRKSGDTRNNTILTPHQLFQKKWGGISVYQTTFYREAKIIYNFGLMKGKFGSDNWSLHTGILLDTSLGAGQMQKKKG